MYYYMTHIYQIVRSYYYYCCQAQSHYYSSAWSLPASQHFLPLSFLLCKFLAKPNDSLLWARLKASALLCQFPWLFRGWITTWRGCCRGKLKLQNEAGTETQSDQSRGQGNQQGCTHTGAAWFCLCSPVFLPWFLSRWQGEPFVPSSGSSNVELLG